jgi:uncharacterized spore protein YtfJ
VFAEEEFAMNQIFESTEKLARSFQERLTARTAYGEPVSANGVTVIPVAKVRFGFGGGGGSGSGQGAGYPALEGGEAVQSGTGGGGGGGGGGAVEPMGFIEITDTGARWVPLEPSRAELILRALLATAVIAPGGGRGGFFRRMLLMLAGQAAVGALTRPRLGALPEGVRFGRFARNEA